MKLTYGKTSSQWFDTAIAVKIAKIFTKMLYSISAAIMVCGYTPLFDTIVTQFVIE